MPVEVTRELRDFGPEFEPPPPPVLLPKDEEEDLEPGTLM